MLFVQNFDAGGFNNVTSCYDTRAFGLDCQTLGAFNIHTNRNTFEVQNDVSHIFTNTRNAGKFMQNVVNLHAGNRSALQRRHQNAAQSVA